MFDVSFVGEKVAGFGLGPADCVGIEDRVVVRHKLPVFGLVLGSLGELKVLIEAMIFSSRTVQGFVALKLHAERGEEVLVEMQICPLYIFLGFLGRVVEEYGVQRIDGLTDSAGSVDSEG